MVALLSCRGGRGVLGGTGIGSVGADDLGGNAYPGEFTDVVAPISCRRGVLGGTDIGLGLVCFLALVGFVEGVDELDSLVCTARDLRLRSFLVLDSDFCRESTLVVNFFI